MSVISPVPNSPTAGLRIHGNIRQLWRWPLLAGQIVKGLALVKTLGQASDEVRIAKFQADLVELMGVHVRVLGKPTDQAALWACNHISWIDAPILGSFPNCVPVAKQEVEEWPVIGDLVKSGGTVFIKRGANQANTVRDRMAELLDAGRNVIVYPEGTTTAGDQVSYVFPRLLSAATQADVPIQPVTIRYGLAENGEDIAPYIDNMKFLPHLRRVLAEKQLQCTVEFLPLIDSAQPRDQLANELRQTLAENLSLAASDNQKQDINLRELIAFLKARHGI
jgi:1-acyl-sn-glycerol-3-phosphate acyltransferase